MTERVFYPAVISQDGTVWKWYIYEYRDMNHLQKVIQDLYSKGTVNPEFSFGSFADYDVFYAYLLPQWLEENYPDNKDCFEYSQLFHCDWITLRKLPRWVRCWISNEAINFGRIMNHVEYQELEGDEQTQFMKVGYPFESRCAVCGSMAIQIDLFDKEIWCHDCGFYSHNTPEAIEIAKTAYIARFPERADHMKKYYKGKGDTK